MIGSYMLPLIVFSWVVVIRMAATLINLVCNAIFGFPFIYNTKIQMMEAKKNRQTAVPNS